MNHTLAGQVLAACAALLLASCSTAPSGVDPAAPAPGVGYVDFYAGNPPCRGAWEVQLGDERVTHFSQRPEWRATFVRLELPAGNHQVTIAGRVGPGGPSSYPADRAIAFFRVVQGQVTPIRVTCVVTRVRTELRSTTNTFPRIPGSATVTIITRTGPESVEDTLLRADIEPLEAFRPKSQMRYQPKTAP